MTRRIEFSCSIDDACMERDNTKGLQTKATASAGVLPSHYRNQRERPSPMSTDFLVGFFLSSVCLLMEVYQ
jgi:hypothetical protein